MVAFVVAGQKNEMLDLEIRSAKIQSRIADSDTKKEIEVGEARREEINSGEDK